MGNNRRKIELLNVLLLSLPGTPVIYYGDEIGMGDNIYLGDRNGVRTPMQWSADRNAGFSSASPQQMYLPVDHRLRISLRDGQRRNSAEEPQFAVSWMKRLIALRKQSRALGARHDRIPPSRAIQGAGLCPPVGRRSVLVVANLSRFPQYVGLGPGRHGGAGPRRTVRPGQVSANRQVALPAHARRRRFPLVQRLPGCGALLGQAAAESEGADGGAMPLSKSAAIGTSFRGAARNARWNACCPVPSSAAAGSAARRRRSARRHLGSIPVRTAGGMTHISFVLLRVGYVDGEPEGYLIPMAFGDEERVRTSESLGPATMLARLESQEAGPVRPACSTTPSARKSWGRLLLE